MTPECVITGCALYSPEEGKSVWGDLHQLGGVWIFNAVLDEHMEARWEHGVPEDWLKVVQCRGTNYFERRGVIVVAIGDAWLNDAAWAHLNQPS